MYLLKRKEIIMSKKIITLGATALTSLTLVGIVQSTSTFADTSDQTPVQNKKSLNIVSKQKAVNIPDPNLKKALNKALGEGRMAEHQISARELATIKNLDLSFHGISSLEGLQYCTNLTDLNISNQKDENSGNERNTFTDLTPIKDLKLESFTIRDTPVTDYSPLKDSPFVWWKCAYNLITQVDLTGIINEDGSFTIHNPCIGFNGEPLQPEDSKGAVYDEKSNTLTWSKEDFEKNIKPSNATPLSFYTTGTAENQSGIILVYVHSEHNSEKPQENVEQSFNIGGQAVGGYSDHSHDSGFARVMLKVKNHKASLIKKSDYQFHWNGWKSSKYASIKLTDPNGVVLYDQPWKGNESVVGNGYKNFGTFAQYDLPEGSTVEIYHAEGPWHRFSTSDNDELKTKLGKPGYTYTYKMVDSQLILQSVE